jgi:mRNA interferase MazF
VVKPYIPDAGDIIWINFDPQAGREQACRRRALVLTDLSYNRSSGLAVVCPLTSRRKPYPFAIPVTVDDVDGAVLADHLKSMDLQARNVKFHSKADPALLNRVRGYVAVLLRLR